MAQRELQGGRDEWRVMGRTDVIQFADTLQDVFGCGGVIISRTFDCAGCEDARVIGPTQNDPDVAFDAKRQKRIERILFK